jgi:hypothetical protein
MLDFLDEKRQVGLSERKVGRRQAMMFDVKRATPAPRRTTVSVE